MNNSKWNSVPKPIRKAVGDLLTPFGINIDEIFGLNGELFTSGAKLTLTIKEAKEFAGVSRATIKRRLQDGSIQYKKVHPGRAGAVRILRSSFEAWLTSGGAVDEVAIK